MKKHIAIILFAGFLLAWSSGKPLLSSAAYNYWYGGQKDVKGLKYTFKLVNTDGYALDSLYVDGIKLKDINSVNSGDTLIVISQRVVSFVESENSAHQLKSPGKAVLYLSNKAKKIREINADYFSKAKLELRP